MFKIKNFQKHELNPNINIFLGANGTGKSLTLKSMYASNNAHYEKLQYFNDVFLQAFGDGYDYLNYAFNAITKHIENEKFDSFYEVFDEIFDEKIRFGTEHENQLLIEKLSIGQIKPLYLLTQAILHQDSVFIIDDIELNLDVKTQKIILKSIKKLSPNSQFIVSTHSPIVVLGSPENTTFWKFERIINQKIFDYSMKKIDNIKVQTFTPNQLLTSPLFDFDDILPEMYKITKEVRTEDNYKEIVISDKRKEELKKIAEKMKKNNDF